jgi:hypothetical protein
MDVDLCIGSLGLTGCLIICGYIVVAEVRSRRAFLKRLAEFNSSNSKKGGRYGTRS